MFDLFGIFGVIFFVMFIFAVINMIRVSSHIGRIQNKVLDAVERELNNPTASSNNSPPDNRPRDYECDQCGAKLGDNADVSPSGDFKCTYCNKWSNIHS